MRILLILSLLFSLAFAQPTISFKNAGIALPAPEKEHLLQFYPVDFTFTAIYPETEEALEEEFESLWHVIITDETRFVDLDYMMQALADHVYANEDRSDYPSSIHVFWLGYTRSGKTITGRRHFSIKDGYAN